MLNQIEEKEKHEQIKTKQSIIFISEAWRKVSEETIKNCRRHADIINALNNEQTKDIIEIVQHKTNEEIQSYLDKFKVDFKPVYTAEEFVHVDDFEDTCKELTEEDLKPPVPVAPVFGGGFAGGFGLGFGFGSIPPPSSPFAFSFPAPAYHAPKPP